MTEPVLLIDKIQTITQKHFLLSPMKKFLYLLLVLPFLGLISSCSDDKDLPNVTLQLDYKGGTLQDNVLYVVQGQTLQITALRAIPAEGTKNATITSAAYFWNGLPLGRTSIMPFAIDINTTDMELGNYTLTVDANVLQVDKEAGFAIAQFPIVIVADEGQEPGEGSDTGSEGSGTLTPDTKISQNER